jgi:K+ transporter
MLFPLPFFFSNLYHYILNKTISATFLVENVVFLSYFTIVGAEAKFADLGHFSVKSIQLNTLLLLSTPSVFQYLSIEQHVC